MKKIIIFMLFGLFFFSAPHQSGFLAKAEARGPGGPPPSGMSRISGKKAHHIRKHHAKKAHKAHRAHHHKRAKMGRISGKKMHARRSRR
ncbi:MAG: hypothetical protein AAF228_12245 [Pseudomonadota bacterium]